jgi:hypothetical protein
LQKIPGFDYEQLPFIVARDNLGIQFVDVRNLVAYCFAESPIGANLFGHGQVLEMKLSGELMLK